MDVVTIILSIIYIVLAVSLVIVVLLQESKDTGLSGAIGGSMDTFFGQNSGRTKDALKKRLTAWGAFAFIALSLVLGLLIL